MAKSEKVADCRWRKIGGEYLLTNDGGRYVFLKPRDFNRFMNGGAAADPESRRELRSGGFIRDRLDFGEMSRMCREKNLMDWKGPNVHVVVVTLRCNFKCGYCSSSARGISRTGSDDLLSAGHGGSHYRWPPSDQDKLYLRMLE